MHCVCGQENPLSASKCSRCGKRLVAGMDPARLMLDAAAAVTLVLALAVILLLDRGTAVFQGGAAEGRTEARLEVPSDEHSGAAANPLRLAVTASEFDYDDMGKLLDTLGSGYRYTPILLKDLLSAKKLRQFDVVFLTCTNLDRSWLGQRLHAKPRGAAAAAERREIERQLKESLEEFVGQGGTLYVSDLQFELLEIAFPEFVDTSQQVRGAVQTVRVQVVDPALAKRLGPVVELRFDKRRWRPAALKGPEVTVYLTGNFETAGGQRVSMPLLAQFPFQRGSVIFTSFHNEAQQSDMELQLLRHLVFTTVTAQLDANIKRTLLRGGFSPVERNLLSVSAKDQAVTQTYECRRRCALEFVLGFEDRGARLRLAVITPDGRRIEQTGSSTFTIDVPQAEPGQWKYTATPLKVPYQNFPFTLTVGEKP
jgi:hypothetical protein